jgi:hypothetical protein
MNNDERLAACHIKMSEGEKAARDDATLHEDWWAFIAGCIALQRATLQRHHTTPKRRCHACGYVQVWPCPDVAAVLNYWLGEDPS